MGGAHLYRAVSMECHRIAVVAGYKQCSNIFQPRWASSSVQIFTFTIAGLMPIRIETSEQSRGTIWECTSTRPPKRVGLANGVSQMYFLPNVYIVFDIPSR